MSNSNANTKGHFFHIAAATPYYTPPPSQPLHPYSSLNFNPIRLPDKPGPQASAPGSPGERQQPAPPPGQIPSLLFKGPSAAISIDFIPAALRRTEYPPPTPPRSARGSISSEAPYLTDDSLATRFSLLSSSRQGKADPLAHIAPEDLELAHSDIDDLVPIRGPPTREQWKPDDMSEMCDYYVCQNKFSLLQRRHHCRHCGNLFCKTHSENRIPLDQNAEFHPRGQPERCCDGCTEDFVKWVEKRVRKAKGEEELPVGQGMGWVMGEMRTSNPIKIPAREEEEDAEDVLNAESWRPDGWSTF